jgi:hypothetical protein
MTSRHADGIPAFSGRPELVEGPFFSLTPYEEGRCFDKLSTNGLSLVLKS